MSRELIHQLVLMAVCVAVVLLVLQILSIDRVLNNYGVALCHLGAQMQGCQ